MSKTVKVEIGLAVNEAGHYTVRSGCVDRNGAPDKAARDSLPGERKDTYLIEFEVELPKPKRPAFPGVALVAKTS